MKKIFLTILALGLAITIYSSASAETLKLPETMKGQATATQNNINYYGGFDGNEAVYNYTNDTKYGDDTGQTVGDLSPYLNFDGTDDYINTNRDIGDNTGALTVAVWIKSAPTAGYADSWVAKDDNNTKRSWWFGMNTATSFAVGLRLGAATNPYSYATMNGISENTWTHVAFTYNQLNSRLYLYKNGVANAVSPYTGVIVDNDQPVTIGTIAGCDTCQFKGGIDDVRIYNRELSATEIGSIYKGTMTDKTGLLGQWEFNEGSSDTTKDNIDETNGNLVSMASPATATSGWATTNGPAAYDSSINKNEGYDLFGFDKSSLTDCITESILGTAYRCFVSNAGGTAGSAVKVMSSRTYVNSGANQRPVMELAALYYAPTIIAGDAYLGQSALDNFAYWGRNLAQSGVADGAAANDAFWGLSGYARNANAQASMNIDSTEYKQNMAKINQLKNEATAISFPVGDWNLQSSNISQIAGANNLAAYPNGKVWKPDSSTGDLTISESRKFSGKGTIIVPGNLTISQGVKLGPLVPTDQNSMLGFIVLGKVIIGGNTSIRAPIVSFSNTADAFTISGSNVDLIGSFVARSFVDSSGNSLGSNLFVPSNIRFYYDKRLDSSWPPGFRYLNMPHPTEN